MCLILYNQSKSRHKTTITGKSGTSGHITKYNHDSLDRVESVVRKGDAGDITVAQYTYDSEDNVLTVTDAKDKVTTFTYDLLNRLETVKEPGKTAWTEYVYDALGNRTKVTDANANGKSTEYNYDDLGRLKTVKDALGKTTEYSYDAVGNLVSVKDAKNNETTYEYDLLSRLTKETKPLSKVTQYSYDNKSRIDYKIDAKNQKIKYNYRVVDNALTSIDYYNTSTDTIPAKTVTFGLDNNGNILTVDDSSMSPSQIYTNIYDNLNRIDTVTANYVNKFMDYDYDQFGNRTSLIVKEGDASGNILFEYSYSYNKLEQLTHLSGPGGSINFDYRPTGRFNSKTFPNGISSNYAYFDNGDLLTLSYASGTAAPLLDLSYTYDNASNIDTKTKDGVLYDYTYNNLYQLTGVTIPSATVQNETFSYDEVGNRLSSIDKPTWNYDENNMLTAYNGVSFGYDDNGNTTSKTDASGTTNYSYSINNRLSTINTPTISASYKYDPMGRRIEKNVDSTITRYLWDGYVIIAELDDSYNIAKLYTYNPQTHEPISMTEGTDTYWYLNDHLSTPQKMVDSSGTVVWSAEHKAFGEAIVNGDGSLVVNNFRFPGQYYDTENGLYYNMYRYYNKNIGRYLTQDPLNITAIQLIRQNQNNDFIFSIGNLFYQYALMSPHVQNVYTYSINNPVKFTDSSGAIVFPGPSGAAGGAIVGGVSGAITGGIQGGRSGGWKGAIAGSFAGLLLGVPMGAATGALTGALGGGIAGGVAGNLAGALMGGLFSPDPLGDGGCH